MIERVWLVTGRCGFQNEYGGARVFSDETEAIRFAEAQYGAKFDEKSYPVYWITPYPFNYTNEEYHQCNCEACKDN